MPYNTTKRNSEIIEMYQAGHTYEEIAQKYDITRQRAHSIVYNYLYTVEGPKWKSQARKIIYPNIKKWVLDNNFPIYRLSELIKPGENYSTTLTKFLTNGKARMDMKTVKILLEKIGMTFEEAFYIPEQDED